MNKKKISLVIIVFTLVVIIALNSIAATGTATVGSLRVRQKPDKNSEIIEIISSGQKVEILGTEGDWYKVRYNNVVGYVSKTYISTTDVINTTTANTTVQDTTTKPVENKTETTSTTTETASSTTINAGENLSQQVVKVVKDAEVCLVPSAFSTKTTTIKNNSSVKVVYDFGIWVKVDYNGQQGWITKNVISVN
jgi:uncharacterized protein YgiM (DUF1202 family)